MPSLDSLIERFDLFLLDAFGVLVNTNGALPGARQLLERLAAEGKEIAVVTNDASRLPEAAARRYAEFDLPITAAQIWSSGMLLEETFRQRCLEGAECLVLGTDDSEEYVRRAGGRVARHREDGHYDAVIVCDDAGYPFLGTLDVVVTALIRLFDAGNEPVLILPNPDIIYPRGEASYGFTAGGAAMLLEVVLARRYPSAPPRFVRLGKPSPMLFRAALGKCTPQSALMIGDQLETDIAGARSAGIESILLESGVSGKARVSGGACEPSWRLHSLAQLFEAGA